MSLFIQNLKKLRKEHKVSQFELAKQINANKSSIVNVENKGVEPNIDLLMKLSSYFNISIDNLVGNDVILAKEGKASTFLFNGDLRDTLAKNDRFPMWFRFKNVDDFNDSTSRQYIQCDNEIEFYYPLDELKKEERIYIEFLNALDGDYITNYYNFFKKYGYLGKVKSSLSYAGYNDINMIRAVFNNNDSPNLAPNLFNIAFNTSTLFIPKIEDNTYNISKFMNTHLNNYNFNNNKFNISGYYEPYDCYVAFGNHMKEIVNCITFNDLEKAYHLINLQMEDISFQTIYSNGKLDTTFVYNSLLAFMYLEILFDLQNDIKVTVCSMCGSRYFLTHNDNKICDSCSNKFNIKI